jgi:AraC-like DNA-binding protein
VERLLGGESDLGQIGVDLGFTSHSHFTSVFRRILGLTPSELRQRAFAASTLETLDRIKRGA